MRFRDSAACPDGAHGARSIARRPGFCEVRRPQAVHFPERRVTTDALAPAARRAESRPRGCPCGGLLGAVSALPARVASVAYEKKL